MKSDVNDMIVKEILALKVDESMKTFLLDIISWELRNINNSNTMRYTREYLELATIYVDKKKE
jgi:hypothetical protein